MLVWLWTAADDYLPLPLVNIKWFSLNWADSELQNTSYTHLYGQDLWDMMISQNIKSDLPSTDRASLGGDAQSFL